ncbi:hypothetical protein BH11PSE8_BH11PSE8_24250 [soil metagenome]
MDRRTDIRTDTRTDTLVATALALRLSHPDAPALAVLDLVMQGQPVVRFDAFDGLSPEGDPTDTRSAFGRLLGAAFAPGLAEAADRRLSDAGAVEAARREWVASVLAPFALRYGLTLCASADDAPEVCGNAPPHSEFELVIRGDGDALSPAARRRALASAQAVFAQARVTCCQAARAYLALGLWRLRGRPEDAEPQGDVLTAAAVWEDAQAAVLEACRQDCPPQGPGARLEVRERPEARPAATVAAHHR